jgi:serine/threonine protein kinase
MMQWYEETYTWLRMELLGKGVFGRVYKVQDLKTGNIYAGKFSGAQSMPEKGETTKSAKKILKELTKAKKMLENEIKIYKRLDHPNIVKYINSFNTDSCYEEKEIVLKPYDYGECRVLILEYYPNGTLQDMIDIRGKLLEKEAVYIVYQLAQVLSYIGSYSINLVHRDIKPANVMLGSDMEIKLGDFGMTEEPSSGGPICGTISYVAPEIIIFHRYWKASDLWALGVILYILLSGKYPFGEDQNIVNRIERKEYDQTYMSNFSENAQDLLKKIFVRDEERIQIDDLLEHPLFTSEPMIKKLHHKSRALTPSEEEFEY